MFDDNKYTDISGRVGCRIRAARITAGITQLQLCGKELSRGLISQIENGHITPSLTSLVFIARRLGCPISHLLEEDCTQAVTKPISITEDNDILKLEQNENELVRLFRAANHTDQEYILSTAKWVSERGDRR